jgi:hypothetical protein
MGLEPITHISESDPKSDVSTKFHQEPISSSNGSRTRTAISGQEILSLSCLPNSIIEPFI